MNKRITRREAIRLLNEKVSDAVKKQYGRVITTFINDMEESIALGKELILHEDEMITLTRYLKQSAVIIDECDKENEELIEKLKNYEENIKRIIKTYNLPVYDTRN